MKVNFLYLVIVLSSLQACTSPGEVEDYQKNLRNKSTKAYTSNREALLAQRRKCFPLTRNKSAKIELNEKTPLLFQDFKKKIYANFTVLCFKKRAGEKLTLNLNSVNRGGSMSSIHFLIPKVSFYSSRARKLKSKYAFGTVIQPAWTGWRYVMDQEVPIEASGKIYVLIEAENRYGNQSISSENYQSTTYTQYAGAISVSGSKEVKAYPTGTIYAELK